MATSHQLCANDALGECSTLEIELCLSGQNYAGFLLKAGGKVHCYINSCPHTGAALNWNPNRFLDVNQEFIQCSLHGALFDKSTGLCVWGPCPGTRLRSLTTGLIDNTWYLLDEDVSSVEIQTGYSGNPLGR